MSRKYRHVLEKLDEIDALLNETSNGWKTKRMSRVEDVYKRQELYVLFESGAYAYRGYAGNVVDRVLKLNLIKMEEFTDVQM